jgi:hypothetical protein
MNATHLHHNRIRFNPLPVSASGRWQHTQMTGVAPSSSTAETGPKCLTVDGAQRPLVALANENLDEALWAAYRRADKAGVTEELLCRYFDQLRNNGQRMGGARHG